MRNAPSGRTTTQCHSVVPGFVRWGSQAILGAIEFVTNAAAVQHVGLREQKLRSPVRLDERLIPAARSLCLLLVGVEDVRFGSAICRRRQPGQGVSMQDIAGCDEDDQVCRGRRWACRGDLVRQSPPAMGLPAQRCQGRGLEVIGQAGACNADREAGFGWRRAIGPTEAPGQTRDHAAEACHAFDEDGGGAAAPSHVKKRLGLCDRP